MRLLDANILMYASFHDLSLPYDQDLIRSKDR